MMAIGKCFSQTLGAQSNTDSYVGYATTGYAMASVTQPSTATSTQGTLTLTSYTDSSCTVPVTGSSISMTLPVASSAAPYGPYGLMSQCSNTLPGSTTVVNNQGGIYSFTNKLEMEAILSVFTSGQGPVYGTFADPYCSVENTNDASGNQLPIYTQWSANGACTYSFLTQKFKTESCNSGNGVAGTGAFSNTWQAFSDNQCTQSVASAQTYSETDVRDMTCLSFFPCLCIICAFILGTFVSQTLFSLAIPLLFFLPIVCRRTFAPPLRILPSPTSKTPLLVLTPVVFAQLVSKPTSTWCWNNTTKILHAVMVPRPSTLSSSTRALLIPVDTERQPLFPASRLLPVAPREIPSAHLPSTHTLTPIVLL